MLQSPFSYQKSCSEKPTSLCWVGSQVCQVHKRPFLNCTVFSGLYWKTFILQKCGSLWMSTMTADLPEENAVWSWQNCDFSQKLSDLRLRRWEFGSEHCAAFDSRSVWHVSLSTRTFWGFIPSPLTLSVSACAHQEFTVCTRGHTATPVVCWPPGRSCDPRFAQPPRLLLQSQVSVVHTGQQHQLGLHAVSLTPAECLTTLWLSRKTSFVLYSCFWCTHIPPTFF